MKLVTAGSKEQHVAHMIDLLYWQWHQAVLVLPWQGNDSQCTVKLLYGLYSMHLYLLGLGCATSVYFL